MCCAPRTRRLLLTMLMVLVQVALLPAQAHWRCMLRTGAAECCCAAHGEASVGDTGTPASCCSERSGSSAHVDTEAGAGDADGDQDDDCCCGDEDPLHFAPSDATDHGGAAHDLPPQPTPALPAEPVTFCAAAPLQHRTNARVRLARPPTWPPLYLRYGFFLS